MPLDLPSATEIIESVVWPHLPTAIFVDSATLTSTGHALGNRVEFNKLLNLFNEVIAPTQIRYYSNRPIDRENFPGPAKFLDWLQYQGVAVWAPSEAGVRVLHARMTIDLSGMNLISQAVILSHDANLMPAMLALGARGARVVLAALADQAPRDLVRAASGVLDLRKIWPEISDGGSSNEESDE